MRSCCKLLFDFFGVVLIREYLLLKTISGVSDKTIVKLCSHFGSLHEIFDRDPVEISKVVGEKTAKLIKADKVDEKLVDYELEKIKKYGIEMIPYEAEFYPEFLKRTSDPPAVIFAYGKLDILKMPMVAIVGSRNATRKSREFAFELAKDLAEVGFVVVSGFAAGVDISAHLGAIETGNTIAVMGSGFGTIYPESNKKYFKKIAEKGLFLTEFLFDTKPDAYNFPRRNRIIAGLSLGVIVVEAAKKSGSLITAKIATDENREVFAVPFFPKDRNRGTNELIKNGAKLVETYLDIIEEFPDIFKDLKIIDKKNNDNNISFDDEFEEKIYQLLQGEGLTVDELCLRTGESYDKVIERVSNLELKDYIFLDIDGKYYIKRGA